MSLDLLGFTILLLKRFAITLLFLLLENSGISIESPLPPEESFPIAHRGSCIEVNGLTYFGCGEAIMVLAWLSVFVTSQPSKAWEVRNCYLFLAVRKEWCIWDYTQIGSTLLTLKKPMMRLSISSQHGSGCDSDPEMLSLSLFYYIMFIFYFDPW